MNHGENPWVCRNRIPGAQSSKVPSRNMSKELELQTINQWVVTPATQDSENLASRSHETRRIPDPYAYLILNGKLVSPSSNMAVEKIVLRGGEIYEAEYDALLKIQDWADKNDSGIALWFSPPYLYGYSSLKIVASEILHTPNSNKVLFNRAVVLDVDDETSLKIANSFSDKLFTDPEELRGDPIFLDQNTKWTRVLSRYTSQTRQIDSSEDILIKKRTLSETNDIYSKTNRAKMNAYQGNYAELEAKRRGLIGTMPDSCQLSGRSAFNTFFGDSLFEGPMASFSCPRCEGSIPAGLGITTCPHCGLTKEEAGSTCG